LPRGAGATAAPRHAHGLCLRADAGRARRAYGDPARHREELDQAQSHASKEVSRRMRYRDPTLRETLAGAYVMGTLPRRAAARFERLMAEDPALGALVAAWRERWGPLEGMAPPVAPPDRVWQAVAREIEAAPARTSALAVRPAPSETRWWDRIAVWRGLAFGASALAAASLALYVAAP